MVAAHFTDQYLLDPQHAITVNLIGLGGTGSHVLNCLGRINEALIAMGHPGLHVYAYDADVITEANKGRQTYSPADVGANKAVVLITRINRHYGLSWEARPRNFSVNGYQAANITVSCVDTAAARLEIDKITFLEDKKVEPGLKRPLYWLDFGNGKETGQVVLGTINRIKQPINAEGYIVRDSLPNVVGMFPELRTINDADQGPSCSVAESLENQDLFINSSLAQMGTRILWNLFRKGMITQHGLYMNLETMHVNPIKIK